MSLEFTEADWSALKAEYCKGFTEAQAEVCRTFCRLRGLIPGKHVIFNLRQSKEWDDTIGAKVPVTKIIFMTTIDAARLIAQRSKEYNGQAPEQYIYLDEAGNPSIVSEIPLPHPENRQLPREPWAVRTTVYRKGFDHPITSVARFDAYASTYKSANGLVLTEIWSRRSPEMLAKCSEMLSLRKGFPEELSNLYLTDEIKTESEDIQPTTAVTPASVVPLPPTVPPVNQTPAIGTDSPRPGENIPPEVVAQIREAIPAIEKIAASPEIQKQLAAEGKKIDQTAIDQLKKDVGLTTASALPEPKKRGRKPKEVSPDNGQTAVGGITDEDIASAGTPAPQPDPNNAREAQEFVESVTSFTKEEAVAQGLPEPPDPLPSKEESAAFVARARKLVEPGVDIKSLGEYTLGLGNKTSSKYLTVGDWTKALTNLEAAKTAGTLKQLVKGEEKPLGTF